jgi:hypothetical protein
MIRFDVSNKNLIKIKEESAGDRRLMDEMGELPNTGFA